MSGAGASSFTATPMPTRAIGLARPFALPCFSMVGTVSIVTITMSTSAPAARDSTSFPIG